jgi:hypothetical protein
MPREDDIESSPVSAGENERVKWPLLNASDDSPQTQLTNKVNNDSQLSDISVVVRDANGMIMNQPTDKSFYKASF